MMMTTLRAILLFHLLLSITTTFNFCSGDADNKANDENERQALLKFKSGLIDPSNRLSSWSNQTDCCTWTGVRCNSKTGRVVGLNLSTPLNKSEYELSGEIGPSLLQLRYLIYFDLRLNNFVNIQIPTFIGSFKNLKYLDLSINGFVGFIPEQLGNLSNLQYLNLGINYDLRVTQLGWVSKLSKLQYLDLSGVDLHRQGDWLSVVTGHPSILEVHFVSCQIDTIIPPTGQIKSSLQVLDLANNNLNRGIHPCLSNLSTSLVNLDLGSNFLQGEIPDFIFVFQKLQYLNLQGNRLTGSLPVAVGQLKLLEHLHLQNNFLSGPIPESLGNLSTLRILNLGTNHIHGSLFENLGLLSKLEGLYLGDNNLTGHVPTTFGLLSNLVTLDLGYNPLQGSMSELHFSKASKLKQIRLTSTNLFFNVSSSWIPPFQLEYFLMSSCQAGLQQFPTWLKSQKDLQVLDLSNAGISDMAPSWFWNWTMGLEFVDLSLNQISGNMSNILLNSSSINLSSNNFTGEPPHVSGNVNVLNIANNSISGPLSKFFCEAWSANNQLAVLDASYNSLYGEIGECVVHWESLVHLNLGSNNLSGNIPQSIGHLYGLKSLRLDNNSFSGIIPSTLSNCSLLMFIDFGQNSFSGSIPIWIWQTKYLMVLRLRSNQFRTGIDDNLCQLSFLIVLDLANNKLSGAIPNCLDNFQAMVFENANNSMILNPLRYSYGYDLNYDHYAQSLSLFPKGGELEYKDNLILVRMIDLSSNRLSGDIPYSISTLTALRFLNLSRNNLYGEIPNNIGEMKILESLDLSMNHLSGEVPQSLSELSFLSHLNLSYNNLSGVIPSSTQLQGFDPLSYTGNPLLCGFPLHCARDAEVHHDSHSGEGEGDDSMSDEFYLGAGIGFAVGFWGACSTLFFNRSCRHIFFAVIEQIQNLVYVHIMVTVRRAKSCLRKHRASN